MPIVDRDLRARARDASTTRSAVRYYDEMQVELAKTLPILPQVGRFAATGVLRRACTSIRRRRCSRRSLYYNVEDWKLDAVINFIVRRVLGAIPLLLFISIVTYAMMALAPGGPAAVLGPRGQGLSPEAIARINALYGLDKPWFVQYFYWLKQLVLHGSLGTSYVDQPPGDREGLREAAGDDRDGRARAAAHADHRDPDRHLRRRASRLVLRQRVVGGRLHLLRHAGVLARDRADRPLRRAVALVSVVGRVVARPRERSGRPIVAPGACRSWRSRWSVS